MPADWPLYPTLRILRIRLVGVSVPDTENALPFLVVIVLIVPAFMPETYRLKRWAVCCAKIGVASENIVKMAKVRRMIGQFPVSLTSP